MANRGDWVEKNNYSIYQSKHQRGGTRLAWTWREFVGTPNEESTHRRGISSCRNPLPLATLRSEGGGGSQEWFDDYQGEKVKQQISLELCSADCDRGRFKSSFLFISPLEILNLNTYYFDRQRAIGEIESWAKVISETIHLDLKQKEAFEEGSESNIYLTTLISSEWLRLEAKLPSGVIESHFQEIYSFNVEIQDKNLKVDVADLFPLYYIDKNVAKLEMIEWSKHWLRNYAQVFTEYANIN